MNLRSFISLNLVVLVAVAVLPKVAPADHHEFKSIFDGKSLENWEGDPKFWRVEDGAITGQTTSENPIKNGNTFIIWQGGELGDFELKLEYKIIGGNSGIQYRSFALPDNNDNKWRIGGYQADFEAGDRFSGICYGEAFRGILADRGEKTELTSVDGKFQKNVVGSVGDSKEIGSKIKKEDWNEYHIIAKGYHLIHKINGVTTCELTDNDEGKRRDKGLLALQLHAGPAMKVQFRNIRVKQLDEKSAAAAGKKKKVVFVAGRRSHGYGAHEHNAGCILLAKHLQQAMPSFECEVRSGGWPADGLAAFADADAVVVYCDGGGGHLLNPHLDDFDKVMDKGVGLVCLHYGVEVPKGKSGDAFLKWMGGYFEPHYSVNPHWTAKYETFPDHPISRGVKPFEMNDEWYFHMRFRPDMQGVTPILSDHPPEKTMSRRDGPHSGNPHVRAAMKRGDIQHTAWAAEREGGGRGFGFTGGHFHWNWGDDNFRKVVLNAIVWAAHGEVPSDGVTTDTPTRDDLEADQDFPKPQKSAQRKSDRTTRLAQAKSQPAATKKVATDQSRTPDTAVANLEVHPDLRATLFAAEPMLLSPSNIDIDHRGRVWVCEIINYRQHRNKRPEGDRILILEDMDGDGKADSKKVFYQGRDIDSPHGICVLGNKIIVSAGPKVICFTDTNGDDVPDKKEDWFTGISGVQHDHGIHAFKFGPDGKLYFNFGNEGKQLRDASGKPIVDLAGNVVKENMKPYQQGMVFRCNPDLSDLETLGWNFRNNWMVAVDSFGTIWQSDNDDDGNRGVRINYVMEFGNYGYRDEKTGAGWRAARTNLEETIPLRHWHLNDPGVVPNLLQTGAGSPTGITIYEGDLLPEIFHGQMIHCDAGPSVTRAYPVIKKGAGYEATIVNVLEGTRDQWFRPSDAKIAPDGSLIVADWYDPGVGGHRMGDLDRGRIFRVVPKDHDGSYQIPEFDYSTATGAVAALQNPNYAVRHLAWTALHSMDHDAESELLKLWNGDNPRFRARALWLLAKIDGHGQQYVDAAASDEDPDIRIVAIRLARQLKDVDAISVVEELATDQSPQVRRECLIALRHSEDARAAKLWATLASQYDGEDRWYLEALGIAADEQWDEFLAEWLKDGGSSSDGSDARHDIIWRSRGTSTPEMLTQLILDPSTALEELPRYFRALDFCSGVANQKAVTEIAFHSVKDEARQKLISSESLARLGKLDWRNNSTHRAALERALADVKGTEKFVDLVAKFDVSDRYGEILEIAQQNSSSSVGIQAINLLLDKDAKAQIEKALAIDDVKTVMNTLIALGNSNKNQAAAFLGRYVGNADKDISLRREALRAMARIRAGADEILKQAEAGELGTEFMQVAAAQLSQFPQGEIRDRAARLFPVAPAQDQVKLPSIRDLARYEGDSGRGMQLFAEKGTCTKCHVVDGKGKEVGPNLSEIGSKLSREALFESILFPSAGISHNYEQYTAELEDGNIVSGVITSQTADEVVITDKEGIVRKLKRSDLSQLTKQTISLMPADLHQLITQQELVDTVAYLATLKKK